MMLALALIWLLLYFTVYDKSTYHIDNVYEPMIRFLFMESMLLGAYFRQNDEKIRNQFVWWSVPGFIVSFAMYFGSKLIFSRYASVALWQFANQLLIFAVLFFLFRLFAGIDGKLERLPKPIKAVIEFISDITLEIYLVQYVLIDNLRNIAPFPLNWLALTAAIILSALALHYLCKGFYFLWKKIFARKEKRN